MLLPFGERSRGGIRMLVLLLVVRGVLATPPELERSVEPAILATSPATTKAHLNATKALSVTTPTAIPTDRARAPSSPSMLVPAKFVKLISVSMPVTQGMPVTVPTMDVTVTTRRVS